MMKKQRQKQLSESKWLSKKLDITRKLSSPRAKERRGLSSFELAYLEMKGGIYFG